MVDDRGDALGVGDLTGVWLDFFSNVEGAGGPRLELVAELA